MQSNVDIRLAEVYILLQVTDHTGGLEMIQLNRSSLIRRAILVTAVALVAAWAAIGLFGARTPSAVARNESWVQAQRRWAARAFTHYRMVMQAPSWCRMDLEIEDERVVKIYQNTCPSAPQSVTELFTMVKRLNGQADRTYCAPGGCECTEQRFANAVYDAQLGFPRSISLRRLRATNWPELWHHLMTHGLPNCLTPLDIDIVNVISLQPLS
jgi:Family of unknown function (DUF6174)